MLDLEEEKGLDKELERVDSNSEEGRAKISSARKLLPVHYEAMMSAIGGEIGEGIEYERLPTHIADMAQLLNSEAPQIGELSNIMTATLAYTRIIGLFRPYILDSVVSKKTKIPCNIYSVNIAPSGLSKDMSFNLAVEVLQPAEKLIHDARELEAEAIAKAIARKKSKEAQLKDEVPEDKVTVDDGGWEQYVKPVPAIEVKGATYEALLAELEIIEKGGRLGNMFFKMSELGAMLKTDPNIDRILMLASELYDSGSVPVDLKKTRELKTGAIEGIGISFMAHTAASALVGDTKLIDKLKMVVSTYFGRRSFFLITSLNDVTANVVLEDSLEGQAAHMRDTIHKNVGVIDSMSAYAVSVVQNLLTSPDSEKLTLSDDAAKLYSMYYILNKTYRSLSYMTDENFIADGLMPEISNRSWRAIKLAGIWSLVEGSSTISAKTMASAIYFTEFTGRGLRNIMASIDLQPYERFVKAVEDREIVTSIRFDSMMKQGYVFKADKNQINTFLVAVNSALQGKAIVIANYDKSVVEVNIVKKAEGKYGVSYIKFEPTVSKDERKNKSYKGFKYAKLELKDLVNLLKIDSAYTPFKFKDGRRSNDNIESTTNYLVFDIDKSDLGMDVLHETYLSGTLHIVATTSDPNNLCKFRLIVPIQQQLGENPQVYKYVMHRIAEELMLEMDPQSTVLSQPVFGYSGGTILDNLDSGLHPMDISGILSDAATNVKQVDYTTTLTKPQQKKEQEAFLHDFEDTFAFVINAKEGLGSISLYSAIKRMERAGLDKLSIETLIHKINNSWAVPMNRSRLQSTLIGPLLRS